MTRQFFSLLMAIAVISVVGCKETPQDFGADFEADQVQIGVGQAINFEDNSIGATSWTWTFQGGEPSTSTMKDPDGILYAAVGTFNVTLTISSDQGDATETKQGYIVVTQLPGGCEGTTLVTDIDGNSYSVVTIGSQCWMGENLKTTSFKDGSSIPEVTDTEQWKTQTTPAFCWYNNDNSHDATYGKLYNWYTIEDARGVCPEGWHVPSDAEYSVLTRYLGSADDVAAGRLKESGIEHWNDPNTGASNSSDFTGLPAGMRFQEGQFDHMGKNGLFWSSRRESESLAFYLTLTYNSAASYRTYIYKRSGFSCRCVKD